MARPPKPWYRKNRDAWYAWIDGRQHLLARGKGARAEAERAFHRLQLQSRETPEPRGVASQQTLADLARAYLDHARLRLKPITYEWYRRHLKAITASMGDRVATTIKPYDISQWMDGKDWSPTTQHGAATAIKRVYRWSKTQGLISSDPLEDLEKPRPQRREEVMTEAQFQTLLSSVGDPQFRDLLTVIHETGCRPGEAMVVTSRNVNLEAGTWVLEGKTSSKTGRKRVVYLTQVAVEICRRLCAVNPTGPIFRNTEGRPWTRYALNCRFRRIRQKLGMGREACSYSLRHLFVTDALTREIPIATVAELVGHASTTMISKVYSHLSERTQHLRDAAERVRTRDQTSGHTDGGSLEVPAEQPAAPGGDGPGKTRRRKS